MTRIANKTSDETIDRAVSAGPDTMRRKMCLGLATLPLMSSWAHAQARAGEAAFAQKTVRLVLPAAAGSSIDALARHMAQRLAPVWGQSVVVENIASGGGILGSQTVSRATPDGHTIGIVAANLAVSPALSKQSPYDLARDFTYLMQIASTPMVLFAHPSVPATNLKEFIEHAKRSKTLNYASAGNGSTGHLAAELMREAANIPLTHIPYKAIGQVVTDTIGGQTAFFFAAPALGLGHVQAGRLKAIGHTGTSRIALAPTLASFADQGLQGANIEAWFGAIAPAGLAPDLQARLRRDLNELVTSTSFREFLSLQGFQYTPKSGDDFRAMVLREANKWQGMAKAGVIQAG